MEPEKESREAGIERLIGSLELVTARMIETAVVNSQLASSQTPEMRELFDTWLSCMSEEIARFFEGGGDVNLSDISETTGLSRESVLTLLVALDRRGKITIRSVTGGEGSGRNSDICGCLE
ncbi:MAG: hypothetical protein FWE55_04230 [Synergistaceae bacterium]|nr:hypothetical protein [Synergistaceae bacterium]